MALSSHSCVPIPPVVLDQAVAWLMRFQSGRLNTAMQTAFDHWLQESPTHVEAWNRAEEVMGVFRQIPVDLRSATLQAAITPKKTSHRMMNFLAIFLACLPLLGVLWRMEAFDL